MGLSKLADSWRIVLNSREELGGKVVSKKKQRKMMVVVGAILGLVIGTFGQIGGVFATTAADICGTQFSGVWDDVYGCRKVNRTVIKLSSMSSCGSIPNSTYSIDGTCTFFTYTYLWGGTGGNNGANAANATIMKLVDNPSDCKGTIKNRDSATGKYVCEEEVSADGSGGDGIDYVSGHDYGNYSRSAHPGREPTENENNDPGSSDKTDNSGIPAVEGNGYSTTGGVKTDPEQLETAVLDCSGDDAIFCILNNVLTVLTWGVGIAATLGLVISGMQYAAARGSVEQMTKAKRRIINIVIGLVVYAAMWGILNWLIPGGLF